MRGTALDWQRPHIERGAHFVGHPVVPQVESQRLAKRLHRPIALQDVSDNALHALARTDVDELLEQHPKWKQSGDSKDEPSKFRFVKGFQRGLELYGEHVFRGDAVPEQLRNLGVIVVEGPNDVIALNSIGVPAMAVCSNTVTVEQADKLAALAREFGGGTVSVMFDLDREGENGGKQAVLALAERCRVRFGWTSSTAGGGFRGRQAESVTRDEWESAVFPALADMI